MAQPKTISVGEYAEQIGETPQVVYGRMATGKMVEGVDWIKESITIERKRIIVKRATKKVIKNKKK